MNKEIQEEWYGGDKCKPTGETFYLHGGWWTELEIIEGYQKGKKIVKPIKKG